MTSQTDPSADPSAPAPFAPRRGRPNASQSLAIERAIRAAAAQAFLTSGYERTAMEAVAAQAGVPKSTLYKRYPDKRALLRAVLSDRLSAWSDLDGAPAPGDDLAERLKTRAAEILHQATTPDVQDFWSLVSTAWSEPDEAQERQDAIGYSRMIDAIERDIRALGPASGVTALAPRRVATALMAMLGGWIEFVAPTITVDRDAEARRFAHDAVDLLMRGSAGW